MYVIHTHVIAHLQKWEDSLQELVISFYHVRIMVQTQVKMFSGKHFYLMNHPTPLTLETMSTCVAQTDIK